MRAYCLLRDALEQSGKIAIAQVALRQRESLAMLRVRDGVLVLETLLWPDEVRAAAFPFLDDDIDVRPQELRMASSLIDSMTVDFDPDEYHDSYREALLELVAAKTEGREVVQPASREADTGAASSLADALRASLAAAKGGQRRGNRRRTRRRRGDEAPAPRRAYRRRSRAAAKRKPRQDRARRRPARLKTGQDAGPRRGQARAAAG